MWKNRKTILIFLACILVFANFTILANEEEDRNIIKVKNTSELDRTNAEVKIVLPNQYSKEESQKILDIDKETELPVKRFDNENNITLVTKLDIKKGEEKELLVREGPPNIDYLISNPSIGTEYVFVNYKRALVISASSNNKVKVLTKDEKVIEEFELGKGELRVLQSEKPQLIVLRAEKPLFVFESTLADHSKLGLIEPGDSDTTTLYGSDLYVYTEKHIWLSSYEETGFKIYDKNNIEVRSKVLQKNSGFFIDDLNSGLYYLTSDHPLTIQFGYLDDENFSFLYGKTNRINGFAFGDLLIVAKYNDTSVDLTFGNTKKNIKLKKANDYEIVPVITEFKQKFPESIFFSATFNKPVLIATFSSGNNFGGEFIPGDNGLFLDYTFNFITGRVSKEFSKEQKNIISIISMENETEIDVGGVIKSKAILERFTDFYLESSDSNGSISIKSNKSILVNHLRSYKDKGLFYFVPPITDKSITASFVLVPPYKNSGDLVSNSVNFEIFSLLRIKDFFINIASKDYLIFTILFFLLIALCIFGIFICFTSVGKSKLVLKEKERVAKREEKFVVLKEEKISKEEALKQESEEEIPHLKLHEITEEIEKDKEQILEAKDEEEKPSDEQIYRGRERERFFELNLPLRRSIIDELKNEKIVLDPGSANRLYVESLLTEFVAPYICKSSIRKLTEDVSKGLKVADLNRQDIERAKIISDRLALTEEAGKAIILAKKINAKVYITSYRLPNKVHNLNIIRVTDLLKDL